MHLAADYVHPTPRCGRCRVRIFLPEEPERDVPVVILTEPTDNPGTSVTNCVERLAAEVSHANGLDPARAVWIEHYERGVRGTAEDPHTFDLVTFSSYEIEDLGANLLGERHMRLGEPTWRLLDRASVEALVGRPVS
jgi:hypothetical protein